MKIILIGPPGSGKGTVSEKLINEFHFEHISPGEILRDEVSKGTMLGIEIKKYMEKGDLVPDKFVVESVKLKIKGRDHFILDGFPRTIEQAQQIKELSIDKVIYLEVPEEVVVERLSGRRICNNGAHTYHLKYLPSKKAGVCDIDKTVLIQRKDDTPKAVQERFKVFHEKTNPLIDYFKKKGLLSIVNGAQEPEKVYKDVKKIVKR